jgi:hypothetical protein
MVAASVPEAVAVDPGAKLLFFTDSGPDTISVASLDGAIVTPIVISAKSPRSLRVNPINR